MKKTAWKVSEAKAHFSEMLDRAQTEPQTIENRGEGVAVVISLAEYRTLQNLREARKPSEKLMQFLRFTEQLREAGGAEIKLPKRRARRSPFAARAFTEREA